MTPIIINGTELIQWLNQLFWPLIRIAAVFSIAPVIGGRYVPARIRIAASLLIAVAALPWIPSSLLVDPLSAAGLYLIAQQLIIGLGLGLILRFIFSAATVAGQTIAYSMGLGFALMTDPQNGTQVPIIGQFLSLMASLIFIAFDGHLALIELLVSSFQIAPIGSGTSNPEGYRLVYEWSAIIFKAAISIALPAIISLLSINILLGVMTRVAPQMNIFSVGFPITLFMGTVILFVTLPSFLPAFERLMQEGFVTAQSYLGAF